MMIFNSIMMVVWQIMRPESSLSRREVEEKCGENDEHGNRPQGGERAERRSMWWGRIVSRPE